MPRILDEPLDANTGLPAGHSRTLGAPFGKFGTGQFRVITANETFTPVAGLPIRVRVFGASGSGGVIDATRCGGGGAGFGMKVIASPAASYACTIGQNSGTSPANLTSAGTTSFGSEISVTGAENGRGRSTAAGGVSTGGDINFAGGMGRHGGGSSASPFGPGSQGGDDFTALPGNGPSGGGSGTFGSNTGGQGLSGSVGRRANIGDQDAGPTPIDLGMLGTGPGGSISSVSSPVQAGGNGWNGGGGADGPALRGGRGGYPGGGGGRGTTGNNTGGPGCDGLIIVEW